MTEQQQKLYDKLLKKVNEFCLGAAAEDVIAAIDNLVDTYETPKGDPTSKALQAIENIIETFFNKDSEDIKTVKTALEEGEKNKEALRILKKHLEPKTFQVKKPYLGITVGQFHASYEIDRHEYFVLREVLND